VKHLDNAGHQRSGKLSNVDIPKQTKVENLFSPSQADTTAGVTILVFNTETAASGHMHNA
jgi:hypothetical protein